MKSFAGGKNRRLCFLPMTVLPISADKKKKAGRRNIRAPFIFLMLWQQTLAVFGKPHTLMNQTHFNELEALLNRTLY